VGPGSGSLGGRCLRLAGRNLTRAEWDFYFGDLARYRPTCPDYPPPAEESTEPWCRVDTTDHLKRRTQHGSEA
jgi:hypothetical protein